MGIWAGVDAGRTHRHCVVIGHDGQRLLSRRMANDERPLLALMAEVRAPGPSRVLGHRPG